MQELMNRDGIGCSQNLVVETTLGHINLIDLSEITDRPPDFNDLAFQICYENYLRNWKS